MTLNEVVDQMYGMTPTGCFNGEIITKGRLKNHILKGTDNGKGGRVVMDIELPDGEWLCMVECLPIGQKLVWDYIIPEDREDEERLMKFLSRIGRRKEA